MPTASNDSSQHSQFSLPNGFIGRIAGWIMALQNRTMNRITVEQLKIAPDDSVLEIGFGPGEAIKYLTRKSQARTITGIDPSPAMLEQAMSTNKQSIDAGRVMLIQGTVAALPFAADRFSKVFAVSTFHDWESRSAGLKEVRRVLKDDGKLVLCLRRARKHPLPWSSPGLTSSELNHDLGLIKSCGFKHVQLISRRMRRRIVGIVGTK
jgi:ubiquinone/menaquinone biosynthesis C-methylase UbiE